MESQERRDKALEALDGCRILDPHRPRNKQKSIAFAPKSMRIHRSPGRYYQACLRKTRYTTKWKAEKVAKQISEARGTSLRAYRCDYCGFWHLSHRRFRYDREKIQRYS